MKSITLSAVARNALYAQVRADLLGIDDLRLAIEADELETADQLARRFAGELRLVMDGLGWVEQVNEPVALSLPAAELRPILVDLRDRAIAQYESARAEQEAFRAPWERAALVRAACDEALAHLPSE